MGSSQSSHVKDGNITREYLQELHEKGIQFTAQEIIQLVNKYRELAGTTELGGDCRINEDEFITKMKIRNEKIGKLMYKLLDADGNGTMDFDEFILGLNIFHPDSPIEKKAVACFRAYDADGSGSISKDEIRSIVNISLENNTLMEMDEEHISELLDDLFKDYASDGEEMTMDDFTRMICDAPHALDFLEFDVQGLLA